MLPLKTALNLNLPSPLKPLQDPYLEPFQVSIDVKHDELIDPLISGNKFRKLKCIIADYSEQDHQGIVSMGGAWSNHLHALSKVCFELEIPFIALVRGSEPERYSGTLQDIKSWGAKVAFINSADYRTLRLAYEHDKLGQHPLCAVWKNKLFIPEGGYGLASLQGLQELVDEIPTEYDYIYVGVGTGTTLAGLATALGGNSDTKLVGVAAVDARKSQEENVHKLISNSVSNWQLDTDHCFNGFAKVNEQLIDFMDGIYSRSGLITEPIYTAKTLYALYEHIQQGNIASKSKVLFIHTGGLQGLRGYDEPRLVNLCRKAGF